MRSLFVASILTVLSVSSETVAQISPYSNPTDNTKPMEGTVMNRPEGRLVTLERESQQFYQTAAVLSAKEAGGKAIDLVFADNGDVYLCNFISYLNSGFDVWLRGHLEGTQMTIRFPQTAYAQLNKKTGEMQYITAGVLDNTYPESVPELSSEKEAVKFDYHDGTFTQVGNDIIGLYSADYYGSWFEGYGEASTVMKTHRPQDTMVPKGLEFTPWGMEYDYYGRALQIAQDGNKLYLKGLCDADPDACVVGSIADGEVEFRPDQYLGYDASNRQFVSLMVGRNVPGWNADDDKPTNDVILSDRIVLAWDPHALSLEPVTQGTALVVNRGSKNADPIQVFTNPYITSMPSLGQATTPENPEIVRLNEIDPFYQEVQGYAEIIFDQPIRDTENNLMDPAKLYYSIYKDDDELITLSPDDGYRHLTESMVCVPATFHDDWDFYQEDLRHYVYLWFSEYRRIGVQSVYRGTGGERRSAIVYTDGTVGTSLPAAVAPEEAYKEYYDLQGRRLTEPASGIFIQVTHLANGTTVTSKQAK